MGNSIPFRLPFQSQDNTDIEVIGSNLAMTYHFPPKSGSYFANHFVMAGEKFENMNPETFLCGENNDLNYLTNKPIPFPYQNTAADEPSNTIRSFVHLRRDTLKLIKVAQAGTEESDIYRIEFIFDADVSCAVRIMLMATEDLTNGSARYKSRKPDYCSEPIMFEKGAGQLFKSNYYIKPDEFQPSELNHIPGAAEMPLVIQLTVEDSCFVGQSESTFAGIEKLSGAYVIKFLKQKIMVDGLCFMTQEIYGIENKTAAQKAADDEPEEDHTECIICMISIRDTLMLPCRHLCLCNICAEQMRTKQSRCPICRANFHALLQIKGIRRKKRSGAEGGLDSGGEELEEISIIEALNGDLQATEEYDMECDLKSRRSSSSRSRRSRPRSSKSNRPESRLRGSGRSIKTEAIVKQGVVSSAPVVPSAPPLTPAFIEMLHQKQTEDDSENDEVDDRIDPLNNSNNSTRNKILSSIVVDSMEGCNNDEMKVHPHLDPSLPGTPMGSDGSDSLAVSLNGSLSSSLGKSNSLFSTRAQITTPSGVKMDECLPSPPPDHIPDDQI